MSHVTTIDIVIKDLDALRKACEECGLEFVEGQTTFKWFGKFMNDSPVPEGYSPADYGKCEHAIKVPGNKQAYEIGVVQNKKTEGWSLLFDSWNGGYGLMAKAGAQCGKLTQEYSKAVVKKKLKPVLMKGFKLKQKAGENGAIVLHLRRG